MKKGISVMGVRWYAVFLAIPVSAHAADEVDWIAELTNTLGDCSGFYEFLAETSAALGHPATGKQMHELANGAKMAAAYALSVEYAAKNETPKPIGAFLRYPESRADTNKTRMHALAEREDSAAIKAESEKCTRINDIQKDLVQQMRNDSVGRSLPTP